MISCPAWRNPRACTVRIRRGDVTIETVVQAQALYEAACRDIRALRDVMIPEDERIEVELRPPAVVHQLRVDHVIARANAMGRVPANA
jgi:hypothetical protein